MGGREKLEEFVTAARAHLDGEAPELALFGVYKTKSMGQDTMRNGVLILTPTRLVFYAKRSFGRFDLESFPLENISSLELRKGFLGHAISFFATGNKVELGMINIGPVDEFARVSRSRIGKKATAPVEVTVVEQIRELAKLRDEGLLTDDEFQTQKTKIIGST